MKNKRILLLCIERDGFKKKIKRWENYEIYSADFWFDDVIIWDQVGDKVVMKGIKNREKIDEVVKTIHEGGYDSVFCESPEAFLVQFVMTKRRLKFPSFIIGDFDNLRRVKRFCNWVEKKYNENPYETVIKNSLNYWFYSASPGKMKLFYMEEGIKSENLFYIPASLYWQDEVFVDIKGGAKKLNISWGNPLIKEVKNNIIACGTSRDYETLAKAAGDLSFPIYVFRDKRYSDVKSKFKNIRVLDFIPLRKFYQILAVSRFVIIPLHESNVAPGLATAGLAIGFGKPVIATDFEWMHEYVVDDYNGILVKPYDVKELQEAILSLNENEKEIKKMGKNSLKISNQLDEIVKTNFKEILYKSANGSN